MNSFIRILLDCPEETIHVNEESKKSKEDPLKINLQNTNTWFTLSEAADYLRISSKTLRRAIAANTIKYSKIGSKYCFNRKWLNAFALGFGKKLTPTEFQQLRDIDII